ncbi:MAG: c-type cytochrome domain-containing protein [Cyclobacteriaceae bacterium]|nr:c-type cytochrome domain-containing protein [Cyclobacteriaceae bacterium]
MDSQAEDVVSNIFHEKCVSCHGPTKQKGDLRLDSQDAIFNSADEAFLQADNSLLMERITLPLDDDDHMPPQGKKQLSKNEIAFLSWWVTNGAVFDKSLAELKIPSNLHGILTEKTEENPLLPKEPVDPAPEAAIEQLRKLGVVILPVADNSNYLTASLVNTLPENMVEILTELIKTNAQLIWLSMDFQNLDESDWESLGQLTALRKLSLRETNFSDMQMSHLKSLPQLVYLNLSGTHVSDLSALENLPKLHTIYLYQTNANHATIQQLKTKLSQVDIDTGNYIVPVLASDTTEFTKADLK